MTMKGLAFVCFVAGACSMRTDLSGSGWWQDESSTDFEFPTQGLKVQYFFETTCEDETWSIQTAHVGSPMDTVLHLVAHNGTMLSWNDDIEDGATTSTNSNLTYDFKAANTDGYVVVRGYKETDKGNFSTTFQCRTPDPRVCSCTTRGVHAITKFPLPGLIAPYAWGSLITWHVPDFGAATMKFFATCANQKFGFTVNVYGSVLSNPQITIFDSAGVQKTHSDAISHGAGESLLEIVNFTASTRGYYYVTVDGGFEGDYGHFDMIPSCIDDGPSAACKCHTLLEAHNFRFTEGTFSNIPYFSIKDDPELVNVMGQKVSLYGAGTYTLVEMPRASATPALKILAGVQPFKNNICDTFITTLDITGTSLGDAGFVSVHAGNSTHEFAMRFGSGDWMPLSELKYDDGIVRARRNKQSFQVVLDIGNVHIKIAKPHVARGRNWNWLNLFISGLRSFNAPVGGVLGLDVPSQDHPCNTKGRRKFIKQQ